MLELKMKIDGKDKVYAGDMVYILRATYHDSRLLDSTDMVLQINNGPIHLSDENGILTDWFDMVDEIIQLSNDEDDMWQLVEFCYSIRHMIELGYPDELAVEKMLNTA